MKCSILLKAIVSSLFVGNFSVSNAQVNSGDGYTTDIQKRYSFSSPCLSQGSWTQAALSQTQQLRQITLQLKNDPSCQSIGQALQGKIAQMQEGLEQAKANQEKSSTLSSLPKEIAALSATVATGGFLRQVLTPTLFGSLMKFSTEKTKVDGEAILSDDSQAQLVSEKSQLLQSLNQRMNSAANRGLDLFNSTIDSLPQLETCLIDENSMGHVFASSISLIGSFVSSGADPVGNKTAMAISKLSDYMRQKRFSKVIKKLNEQEFLSSVSCLIDATTESYCSARDGRLLFNEMTKNFGQNTLGARKEKSFYSSPLAGYYVLTQQIPVITNWLFKIQIGSTPRLKEDADFQTKVLNVVNTFFGQMKNIEGYFYNQLINMQAQNDRRVKQNILRQTVQSLHSLLIGQDALGGRQSENNFFTMSYSAPQIPFVLIGISQPEDLFSPQYQGDPIAWLDNNATNLPEFQDPDALALRIERNLQALIKEGTNSAVNYYNKNFIVDQIGIVNESLAGMNYNVKEALSNVDRYLHGLKQRIEELGGDQSIIASIIETRIRIGRVLSRYKELKHYSIKASKTKFESSKSEEEFNEKLRTANLALIVEVYEQFQVLMARTGWLSNRLANYVKYDYQNVIRSKMLKNPYTLSNDANEIFQASAELTFEKLLSLSNGNPANIDTDLNFALRIGKENVAAIEMLLKDSVAKQISELRLSTLGKQISSKDITYNSVKRAYMDEVVKTPSDRRNSIHKFFAGLWSASKAALGFNPTSYPVKFISYIGLKDKAVYSSDDEFGSAKKLYNQLCIQALAFNDLKSIWYSCKGAILKSPLDFTKLHPEIVKRFKTELNIDFVEKAYESLKQSKAMNESNRICAFRNYNRKNLVAYLTLGKQEANRADYENEHTRISENQK